MKFCKAWVFDTKVETFTHAKDISESKRVDLVNNTKKVNLCFKKFLPVFLNSNKIRYCFKISIACPYYFQSSLFHFSKKSIKPINYRLIMSTTITQPHEKCHHYYLPNISSMHAKKLMYFHKLSLKNICLITSIFLYKIYGFIKLQIYQKWNEMWT